MSAKPMHGPLTRGMLDARRAAMLAGQAPAHYALTSADYERIGPGSFGGVEIKLAPRAAASHLWARKATRLVPWPLSAETQQPEGAK